MTSFELFEILNLIYFIFLQHYIIFCAGNIQFDTIQNLHIKA